MPAQPVARTRSRLIMIVLLPPSEGKAAARRRGTPVRLDRLTLPGLADARRRVLTALVGVSASPAAAAVLKVGAGQAAEVAANLTLDRTPAAPAGQVYTGVLYDALDLATLPPSVRARAARSVLVQSALWGPVSLTDRIAPYRLSMGVSLPGVGPLAGFWRTALDDALPGLVGSQVLVDCRSSSYAAAWRPGGDLARRSVAVRVWTQTAGVRTVVSHQAKHTRGLVARWLLAAGPVRSVRTVAEVVGSHVPCELVDLGRAGWALDVVTDAASDAATDAATDALTDAVTP